MDMREASAMTEASGLTNAQGGIEQASAASPEAGRGPRSLHAPSPDDAMGFADQLRKIAIKAPLQSLVVAFLLGSGSRVDVRSR
ncbi:hypothetical protein [Bradyrhizobium liaoningense]|uniref:hypothetical protein n=1 Tax=Bradyrhizobium liaoningense TaxID=43992 RepID=UPI00201393F3|nr:hypothetical protein [Bradyrhizobium liaoningense]